MLLKEARKAKGLTQIELAEAVSTTQTVISYLEAGHRFPIKKIREGIERALGKKVDWIGTRLQGAIRSGFYEEDETAEDMIVKAIFEFIQSAQTQERSYRFQFLKQLIKELEKKNK